MKKIITIFYGLFLFNFVILDLQAESPCVQMGCFCGQENIPPSCYQTPFSCCEGEGPSQDNNANTQALFNNILELQRMIDLKRNELLEVVNNTSDTSELSPCIEMGCFCGQTGIAPSCYSPPTQCCDLERINTDIVGCEGGSLSSDGESIHCPNGNVYTIQSSGVNNVGRRLTEKADTNPNLPRGNLAPAGGTER
jgi:hypothetical protein